MYINNKKIDTEPILHLIEKGKTIAAIKYVRGNTNIGLKVYKNNNWKLENMSNLPPVK